MFADLHLIARPHRNGGYAPWRSPVRRGKGQTTYELADGEDEPVLSLGTLATGMGDEELAEFWGRAIYRLRRYGLDEKRRREIAGQLKRAGVPLPETADWPGASRPGWADVAAELVGLIPGQR